MKGSWMVWAQSPKSDVSLGSFVPKWIHQLRVSGSSLEGRKPETLTIWRRACRVQGLGFSLGIVALESRVWGLGLRLSTTCVSRLAWCVGSGVGVQGLGPHGLSTSLKLKKKS